MADAEVYDRSSTVGYHAAGLDESAHALNHATRWIRSPGEIDRVAANLSSTVAKFPQAFGSMRDWLPAESAAGRLVDSCDPDTATKAVEAVEPAFGEAIGPRSSCAADWSSCTPSRPDSPLVRPARRRRAR